MSILAGAIALVFLAIVFLLNPLLSVGLTMTFVGFGLWLASRRGRDR